MTTTQFIQKIRDLIAQDELESALSQLRILLENSPNLDEAIHQSGRFQAIRKQIRQGTISHADATLTRNQISAGLLDFLREIETQAESPELKSELAQAISITISNSENVVVSSQITGQNVHIGNIVYQNAPSAPVPSLPPDLNQKLTRSLVEAMSNYNSKAQKLSTDFSWLQHPENRRKVQQFVFQNFVGEIGKQLRKLVNIGDNEQMEPAKKQRHYADKCLDIAKRSFELLNYTLLSSWWDVVKIAPRSLDAEQEKTLRDFFEKHLEHDLAAQFKLLATLYQLFEQHKAKFPFVELPQIQAALIAGSPLEKACTQLESAVKALDCSQCEEQLAAILPHFVFLTQYRMASIKKIGYRQIRNGQPEYLHRYVALGIDVKYSEDAEKGRWITLAEQTPAVLLYRGEDYKNGHNLFPFVIDYNALTFEHGAKICFFSAKDLNDDRILEYRFLGDNSLIRIEREGIHKPETKLDELMMNPEELKALNLDCVVNAFHDARRAILGETDNFFDDL